MCGIVSILQYESEVDRDVRHRALKILFSDSMQKTETRGEDATGIYQVHANGDWAMTKKGIKASEWLFLDGKDSDDPVVYSDFMDSWLEHPQELTALVGHCRKATVGSKGKDNDDNHPFAVQLDENHAILGIHNGTLNNHETIFSKLPKFLKRQGKVDSESIFHLMFHLSEYGTKPWDADMMKKLGARLDGAAACVVVNTRFPTKVATWRFGRPMDYFLIAPLNIVIICSEKKFVESALEKYELYRKLFDKELPELETWDSSLIEKDFRIFDTSIPWPAGTPGFKDLNVISERGDIKPFNAGMEPGWYTPATTTTPASTYVNPHAPYTPNRGYYSGAGTVMDAKVTKPVIPGLKALPASTTPAKKEDNDKVVVVEVEIGGQEEAQAAQDRAKSMGICTSFDTETEIAQNIGITSLELERLTKVELANAIGKAHFNFGYAVSKFDTKAEIEKNRKGARDMAKRLEKAEEKKKRSENVIWGLKQIITLMLGLNDSNYPINHQNICIALSAFSSLGDARKKDISEQSKAIFEDSSVKKTVVDLRKQFKRAKEKKDQRSGKADSAKD